MVAACGCGQVQRWLVVDGPCPRWRAALRADVGDVPRAWRQSPGWGCRGAYWVTAAYRCCYGLPTCLYLPAAGCNVAAAAAVVLCSVIRRWAGGGSGRLLLCAHVPVTAQLLDELSAVADNGRQWTVAIVFVCPPPSRPATAAADGCQTL